MIRKYFKKIEKLLDELDKVDKKKHQKTTNEKASEESFVDLTNIHLKGALGNIWMIFRLCEVFKLGWNYFWYIPLMLFLFLVALSPAIIPLFFTYKLFEINAVSSQKNEVTRKDNLIN